MDNINKKRVLAMVAIAFAAALIIVSVVALVTTNASTGGTSSQTEQVQSTDGSSDGNHGGSGSSDGNHGDSSENTNGNHAGSVSSTSENNDGNHQGASTNDGNHASSTTSTTTTNDGNHQDNSTNNDGNHAFTVYITIDGAGHGNVSYAGNVTVDDGASVYDALKATGVSVNARDSQYGTYVAAIGGLAEKSAGGESGWKYSVNGVEPNTACSNYTLKSGDVVKWKFVTKASESIG